MSAVLARRLWPLIVRALDRADEGQWPMLAACVQPFLAAPQPATFLASHRALSGWLRRDTMRRTVTSRWQAELDAVRHALGDDARFASLSSGAARDARSADRLSALALVVTLRELAEAKGEAAAALVRQRLMGVPRA